ncbi:transposase [Lewinella sp. LCG006]|uniref:transposase n=1 Tax=Lewinella sp. LCG006 TaxID=3231911 RepID=UPI003460A9A7
MQVPLLSALRADQCFHGIAMERFYELEGISRQAYFQGMLRQKEEQAMMLKVAERVKAYRQNKDRHAGSRSLYYNLGIKELLGLGVSKFERLLSEYNLTLAPYKTRLVTTQSCARSRAYSNLARGLIINGINQLVVGDLTYIKFADWVYYLFMLTDVYSARIVGWYLGQRMRAIEAHHAFKQWEQLRDRNQIKGSIHHTDGGSQYFANLYLESMNACQLRISVADNCLDNGFAEQRNGLLKQHFLPTVADLHPERITQSIDEIMYFYNHERKQEALGWLSPVEFEQQWANHPNPPRMQLYDRQKKILTTRQRGFLEA